MIPPLTLLPVTAWFVGHVGPVGTSAVTGLFVGVMFNVGRRLWNRW